MTNEISYKDSRFIVTWMDLALKAEWRKFAQVPVTRDIIPEAEVAQGWGYVIAGYSLIEQGLKAILFLRSRAQEKTHVLSSLWSELSDDDQSVLNTYYDDFIQTFSGVDKFPFETLEGFLVNLDGGARVRGQHVGSLDWRYFLTERSTASRMPQVSIYVMHEVAYACIRVIDSIVRNDKNVVFDTYSWRLRQKRLRRLRDWLTVRMNSPKWGQQSDRIEILWGPDYADRYDYLVFEEDRIRYIFVQPKETDKIGLMKIDKRDELKSFDPAEGFRSIGVTVGMAKKHKEPELHHLMY